MCNCVKTKDIVNDFHHYRNAAHIKYLYDKTKQILITADIAKYIYTYVLELLQETFGDEKVVLVFTSILLFGRLLKIQINRGSEKNKSPAALFKVRSCTL